MDRKWCSTIILDFWILLYSIILDWCYAKLCQKVLNCYRHSILYIWSYSFRRFLIWY